VGLERPTSLAWHSAVALRAIEVDLLAFQGGLGGFGPLTDADTLILAKLL
jgi:hypothetical protein